MKIMAVHVKIGIDHALMRSIVWNVVSPLKYPFIISRSDTVNHDGIYFQKSCSHSFSGEANQKGCARVPMRLVIIVAPEIVDPTEIMM